MTDTIDSEHENLKAGFEGVKGAPLSGPDRSGHEVVLLAERELGETKIISARGTEDGLVLRLDGRADWSAVMADIRTFIEERRTFLKGAEVTIEWLDRLPTREQTQELEGLLRDYYEIEIVSPRKRGARRAKERGRKDPRPTSSGSRSSGSDGRSENTGHATAVPLFGAGELVSSKAKTSSSKLSDSNFLEQSPPLDRSDDTSESDEPLPFASVGINREHGSEGEPDFANHPDYESAEGADPSRDYIGERTYFEKVSRLLGDDVYYDEEANARVVYTTLRSGQRIESPFSLIVVGDVNPGADLISGGDIIVLGSLRGTAHAGAYDEEAFDRVIVALQMSPMQLRIGSVISRGNGEPGKSAEIARIEDRRIIVESFGPAGKGRRFRGLKRR